MSVPAFLMNGLSMSVLESSTGMDVLNSISSISGSNHRQSICPSTLNVPLTTLISVRLSSRIDTAVTSGSAMKPPSFPPSLPNSRVYAKIFEYGSVSGSAVAEPAGSWTTLA